MPQTLPPATNIRNLHSELAKVDSRLTVLNKGKVWPQEKALRAGVSSFGFGGINVHIALERNSSERRSLFTDSDKYVLSSAQDAELLLFSGKTHHDLLEQLISLDRRVSLLSYSEISDLAVYLAKSIRTPHSLRAAVVTRSPKQLSTQIKSLIASINDKNFRLINETLGLFLWTADEKGKIAFLFPGQVAPVRKTGGALAHRFDFLHNFYKSVSFPKIEDQQSTELAQPAIITAELAGLQLLEKLNIQATNVLGHSLGELTALHWASALDAEDTLRIATLRGKVMAQDALQKGAMASIRADKKTVARWINGQNDVHIACINSPLQTIISGPKISVDGMCENAQKNSYHATLLPVSRAFHSPAMCEAAKVFSSHLASQSFSAISKSFLSSVTGQTVRNGENLNALLVNQLTQPVQFIDAFKHLDNQIDLLIEVGPGSILSRLTAQQSKTPCISLDVGGDSLSGLLSALAACHVMGVEINRELIFYNRFSRPIDLDKPPGFISNPCEKAPLFSSITVSHKHAKPHIQARPKTSLASSAKTQDVESKKNIMELLVHAVATRLELPVESISPSNRLLIDLHLNSISVGQLVTSLAQQLSLPAPAAATDYSNATIQEVAQALEDLKASGLTAASETNEKYPKGIDAWVRAFQIRYEAHKLPDINNSAQAIDSRWLLYTNFEKEFSNKLVTNLRHAAFDNGILLVLDDDLNANIALLLDAAKTMISNTKNYSHFVLVQATNSVASFARTFFQEHSKIKTTIVNVSLVDESIPYIIKEVNANSGFVEARYDQEGIRRVPFLALLDESTPKKTLPLGKADVVLVSGGGKGIAAECALQLAKRTGASLVLLGRAKVDDDEELRNNLSRFREHGCNVIYFSVDVIDGQKVAQCIEQAQNKLGNISAIIHGAGVNHPCLINQLTEELFHKTLSTKLRGAENLLAAINPVQLRLFVAFSSIIGRTGMRGEADYALANEHLTLLTKTLKRDHPACRCLSLEWSVWSGVGMGERLGRIDALINQGISPISPDKGVEIFLDLISRDLPTSSLVVSGRLGEIDTLSMKKPELPFQRFLEQPRVYYSGIELITDVELSLISDPYLLDHQIDGEFLFPAVMGMEAMAQVACALFSSWQQGAQLSAFSELEFLQPIVVPADEPITLRVASLINSHGDVEIKLRSSRNGFTQDHFTGKCRFAQKTTGRKSQLSNTLRVPLTPEKELYENLLFHKGKFRLVSGYQYLHALHCKVDIEADEETAWFSRYLPQQRSLTNPGSRDAAMHAIQACIPHARLLPVAVARIEFFEALPQGPWLVDAKQQWQDSNLFCYDLELFNAEGILLERWVGLKLRKVSDLNTEVWAEPLLVTYMERRIPELIPGADLRVAMLRDPDLPRQLRSTVAIAEASGVDQAAVIRRPDGKPELIGNGSYVSASHHDALTLAVSSPQTVSCDIECVMDETKPRQQDVIGADLQTLAQIISQSSVETTDVSATRIWVVRECLKKAGVLRDTPIVLSACHKDGWVLLSGGENIIATYPAKLRNTPQAVVIGILVGNKNAKL